MAKDDLREFTIRYSRAVATFDGKSEKIVAPAELFASDPVSYFFEKGEYLCLEIEYSGDMIPYHEESMLPAFVKGEDGWKYDRRAPFASMIGCAVWSEALFRAIQNSNILMA